MEDDPLTTSVQYVPGVGPARAALLERLDIRTIADLLWYLPRDAIDLTDLRNPRDLERDVMQTVRGRVVDRDARELSQGRTLTAVLIDCGGIFVRATWFNQPWMLKKFEEGQAVLFSGKPKRQGSRWEFNNPHVQWIGQEEGQDESRVLTRYGLTEGLKMHDMRRIIRRALERFLEYVADPLPEVFRAEHDLPHLQDAIRQVHCPADVGEFARSQRRLVFDDLLEFQVALALRRRAWRRTGNAPVLPTTQKIDARIRRLFPFEFTPGQDQAVGEIVADLASSHAMHRLLQAEVGAGKTAVALYAMLVAVAAGCQTALMAPTELLASQHGATVDRLLQHSRVRRALLTGSLTPAQRRKTLAAIQDGEAQLVVGTQAVIQQDVRFQKLGLVVIDEQHKFGVAQRASLSDEAHPPHVLVMTATPIPRSLCLTQFGDLDITRIADMPPGRQPVVTSRVHDHRARQRAWDFIRRGIRQGRQAYIVCPRIETSTSGANARHLDSAQHVHQRLTAGELKGFRVELIHGQMDRDARADIMESFRNGQVDVLVSTTVIEVGVDVPNATLMVVYQADLFGLSQLHQLRGRISRGRFQGYCFLFSETPTEEGDKRLEALEKNSDGFEIAEIDFALRGPGDVLGIRQHGQLPLRVADLARDQKTLVAARRAAFQLVDSQRLDQPEFAPLKIRVLDRFGLLMDLRHTG